MHKYGTYDETTGFALSEDYIIDFEKLLEESVKYYFIKGLVDNSVNTIKDVTFRVCAKIALSDSYLSEFHSGITDDDKSIAFSKLSGNALSRYLRGIIILTAYLNPNQDKVKLADMLLKKYDIEHILPKSWNHYDGWTELSHKKYINYIGNLMLLERKINIKAQNEYFRKKKEHYKKSDVQDALDMLSISDSGWVSRKVKEIHLIKLKRLLNFFGLEKQLHLDGTLYGAGEGNRTLVCSLGS